MNTTKHKMNIVEALEFLEGLPDDEISVDPIIDVPIHDPILADINKNQSDKVADQDDFVNIQIIEITNKNKDENQKSPQRLFTIEMLENETTNCITEDLLFKTNVSADTEELVMETGTSTETLVTSDQNISHTDVITESNGDVSEGFDEAEKQAAYEADTDTEESNDAKSRSRKRNVDQWQRNIRKRLRQSGQEYHDVKGKLKRARELKEAKDCGGNCRFKCTQKISPAERKMVFNEFWGLSDTEKQAFYMRTTEKIKKKRATLKEKTSRRQYSYIYSFIKDSEKIRVCKEYYLRTLDISQRRIEWAHAKAQKEFMADKRGKHVKYQVADSEIEIIKDHINSFPRVPSHYCRRSSQKEYLESNLCLAKMYSLYVESCKEKGIDAQKEHVYRQVFDYEFNLDFHVPKKDRCDTCEEYIAITKNGLNNPKNETKYHAHMKDKEETYKERENDRNDKINITVAFDLENVITCPRANISNFFYKRKLNVYNLTGHCSANKKAYNALWCESIAGRGANEIASALCKILCEVVVDVPGIIHLTLWSDSCVPQNRNSVMSFALKQFMIQHPTVRSITQKFCTPGHSSIQEVDNIHSHNEKALKVAEIYSPVSLLRVMLNVRPNNTRVIQLKRENFMNYQKGASYLSFIDIPYTKVKIIRYDADKPFHVSYKVSYSQDSLIEVNIRGQTTRSCKYDKAQLPSVVSMKHCPSLTKDKKNDLKSMMKFMPLQDADYFKQFVI